MKLQNKKRIILICILILAVIAIGSYYSFAYFTSSVEVDESKGSGVSTETARLIEVEYNSGSKKLELINAYPGISDSKDFTVKVTPTEDQKTATYSIKLLINNNTFKKCDDSNYNTMTNNCVKDAVELVVTLTDSNNQTYVKDVTSVSNGEEVFLLTETKTPNDSTTYDYQLKVEFKNTDADQNHNANKSFDAELKVEF